MQIRLFEIINDKCVQDDFVKKFRFFWDIVPFMCWKRKRNGSSKFIKNKICTQLWLI